MAAGCKPAAPCELRGFESSPVHHWLILDCRLKIYDCRKARSPSAGVRCQSFLIEGSIINRQSKMRCGSNSMVESQPSKLLVAGSIPVSRSISKLENRNSAMGLGRTNFDFRISSFSASRRADVAQLVEHVLGKDGVSGSIPLIGSRDSFEALIEAESSWPRKNLIVRSRT